MPIYTRTGDDGTTAFYGGKRIYKNHELVEAEGLLDEVNAHIGFLTTIITILPVQEFLRTIQQDIFTIGSVFAGKDMDLKDTHQRIKEMEDRMDAMGLDLPEIHEFIIPGGSSVGASIHIARTVVRRAERHVVSLFRITESESLVPKDHIKDIVKYLNRCSDFLFVLARFINKEENAIEYKWKILHKNNK